MFVVPKVLQPLVIDDNEPKDSRDDFVHTSRQENISQFIEYKTRKLNQFINQELKNTERLTQVLNVLEENLRRMNSNT